MKVAERWFVMAGVGLLGAIALAGLIVAIYAAWLFHDLPDAGDLADYRPPTATRVYAWDGTLIGEFSRRAPHLRALRPDPAAGWSRPSWPPRTATSSSTAASTSSGLGRAMLKNVFNAARGPAAGGRLDHHPAGGQERPADQRRHHRPQAQGSHPGPAGWRQTLTKEQILELYLNEIWLGYRSLRRRRGGLQLFRQVAERADAWPRCAYLAALPKGPDNYHPIRRKAHAMGRRNWILGQMAELGWVTRAEADGGHGRGPDGPGRAAAAPQYRDADYLRRGGRAAAAVATLGHERSTRAATTCAPRWIRRCRRRRAIALMHGLENYDRRHGWRGAWGHVPTSPTGWEAEALAKPPPAERRDWRAGRGRVASTAAPSQVRIADGGATGRWSAEDVAWANAGKGAEARRPDLRRAGRAAAATACSRCRRSTAPWWPSSRSPAGCWPWSAAIPSPCPTSTAPPRRCASPARPSSRSSTPRRWRTATRRPAIVIDAPITFAGGANGERLDARELQPATIYGPLTAAPRAWSCRATS